VTLRRKLTSKKGETLILELQEIVTPLDTATKKKKQQDAVISLGCEVAIIHVSNYIAAITTARAVVFLETPPSCSVL